MQTHVLRLRSPPSAGLDPLEAEAPGHHRPAMTASLTS